MKYPARAISTQTQTFVLILPPTKNILEISQFMVFFWILAREGIRFCRFAEAAKGVASSCFRLVHGVVCFVYQNFSIGAVLRKQADSDAGTHGTVAAVYGKR